ncbi:Putative serine protease HtrA [Methylophilaceae bacterium]|nr:Putative serine protease HtrA [Methylophilaceae bacterium]
MRRISLFLLIGLCNTTLPTAFGDEKAFELNNSVLKVHVADQNGNHGIGSGVVVSENHVATNCHVLANARGVHVTKLGQSFSPVAFKADWQHDLCILKFVDLPLKAVALGEARRLKYEEPVFSISFPNNARKPLTTYGNVKALYPLDDSLIIRTTADFRMGASGGALFNESGKLIGITTFKSPGRNAYFYNLPVEWVKQLLAQEDISSTRQTALPFWDAPEEKRPFFMRVVLPYQAEKWEELAPIAMAWVEHEPLNSEAWYYLGVTEYHRKNVSEAVKDLKKATQLNQDHAGAYYQLGVIAAEQGNQAETERIRMLLSRLDSEAANALEQNTRLCTASC